MRWPLRYGVQNASPAKQKRVLLHCHENFRSSSCSIINRYGPMGMSSPAIGMISHDVVQDAIHDVGDLSYDDLARLSVQHIDTTIGRLQGELERRSSARDPDTIYRLTSPVYWLKVIGSGVVRLWGSTRGRIAAVVGALLLATFTAVLSGVAQAFAEAWLPRP
jgi:uncharacterized small protein (DUF1192 family)